MGLSHKKKKISNKKGTANYFAKEIKFSSNINKPTYHFVQVFKN